MKQLVFYLLDGKIKVKLKNKQQLTTRSSALASTKINYNSNCDVEKLDANNVREYRNEQGSCIRPNPTVENNSANKKMVLRG